MITCQQLARWIERYAELLAEQKEVLTDLDAAIGDADHGANMHRGFQAVLAKRAEFEGKNAGDLLKLVAMTLISSVGGASGPLYGTFFLQGGVALDGKTEVTPAEFGEAFEKGLSGVARRGKAVLKDKTMIDAMQPAVEAYRAEIGVGSPLDEALGKAAAAAEAGLEATRPLVARKGRASYLGERSAGHLDPGAASTVLLFRAAAEALSGD